MFKATRWAAATMAVLFASGALADAPRAATKAELEYLKKGMETRLKDPESARFSDVMVTRSDKGVLTACGQVNAKNSYGGYVGSTRFIGMLLPESKDALIFKIDGADESIAATMCADNGM